jgi:hypothetical protein
VTQTVPSFQAPKQCKACVVMNEGSVNIKFINTKMNIVTRALFIRSVSYFSRSLPALPVNNTNLNFKILATQGGTCSIAGTCGGFLILHRALPTARILQCLGCGTAANQTYESCVDIVAAAANTTATNSTVYAWNSICEI